MNRDTVLNQIKQGRLLPLYLLYGEEIHLAETIEQAIIDASVAPDYRELNLMIYDRDPDPLDLVGMVETIPFLGDTNLIVVRDTRLFKPTNNEAADNKGDQAALLKLFSNMPPYSRVVFMTTQKVDKRRKLFKTIEQYGAAVELAPLKARDVRAWLQDRLAEMNKKLTLDATEQLLSVVSMMPKISLSFLDSELTKLCLYAQDQPVITKEHLTASLAGVPELSVFAAIEAASQKQTVKALTLLSEQLGSGERPLGIAALLARQVRLLWQVKDLAQRGGTSRDIAARLNLHPFVAEKLVRQSQGFATTTLKQAMLDIATFDRDFKTGKANGVALEQLVIQLCQN